MGIVTIQNETTKCPISLMGKEAGICWGADTEDNEKNYNRGLDCINSDHGRVMEYPEVYMILDGYSARVIREFYTHIGGAPTRLQASTRYINYSKGDGFEYVTPATVKTNPVVKEEWDSTMHMINDTINNLISKGVSKEDAAMLLPLGMTTKIVVKINARTLVAMSRKRMCSRANWEFRQLFNDIKVALSNYSSEWQRFVGDNFKSQCEVFGYCIEKKCCGRKPSADEYFNYHTVTTTTIDFK